MAVRRWGFQRTGLPKDGGGAGQRARLLSMPELAVLAVAKREELAMSAEDERVPATRDADHLNRGEAHHEPRHCLRPPLAVAELAEGARAPRVPA